MINPARIPYWPGLAALLALLYGAAACGDEPHIPPPNIQAPRIQVSVSQAGEVFTVEATVAAPVSQKTAWEVLTDFDHMAAFSASLTLSKVVSRQQNTLIVQQDGVAKVGIFSFSYQSEREVRLDPMKRISSRNLSGTAKRMESETQISKAATGVQITYRAEIVPDSALARMFSASHLQQQAEEQFKFLVAEMQRRESSKAPLAALPVSR